MLEHYLSIYDDATVTNQSEKLEKLFSVVNHPEAASQLVESQNQCNYFLQK